MGKDDSGYLGERITVLGIWRPPLGWRRPGAGRVHQPTIARRASSMMFRRLVDILRGVLRRIAVVHGRPVRVVVQVEATLDAAEDELTSISRLVRTAC